MLIPFRAICVQCETTAALVFECTPEAPEARWRCPACSAPNALPVFGFLRVTPINAAVVPAAGRPRG